MRTSYGNRLHKIPHTLGAMIDGKIITLKVDPIFEGHIKTLGEIRINIKAPDYCFRLSDEKMKYLKGDKKYQ